MLNNNNPKLSIIVIAYDMPRQVYNTAYSLSPAHQWNVATEDYEILVVENRSKNNADGKAIESIAPNIRYFLREETGVSPAPAINFALQQARGTSIGMLIDGARMVTPRVVEYALGVQRFNPHSLYGVPGYFIGPCEHQNAAEAGYTEAQEIALLEQIRWQENGYRLFDIATMSAANPKGVFQPFLECNCFFSSKSNFEAIGGADERFDLKGGGSLNFYLFKSIGMLPGTEYYFLAPGEGSFHQLHGGVTTSTRNDRQEDLLAFRSQLEAISGESPFSALTREPNLIGGVTSHSQKFLQYASRRAMRRFGRMAERKQLYWRDDADFQRWTNEKP